MQSEAIVGVDGWNKNSDDLFFVAFRASIKRAISQGMSS